MAYFTNSQGYLFLCSNIVFEGTGFLIVYKKKVGIVFIVNDKSNSVKSFWKMGGGEENLFSKRCLPRKTFLQQPLFCNFMQA